MTIAIFAIVMAVGLALEFVADVRGRRGILHIGKPLASTAFLALASHLDALATGYGQALFAGLLLSWFGDMFLIPKGAKHWFLAGLVSFLLGHVAYVVAFIRYGGDTDVLLLAAGCTVIPAAIVLRWLWPTLASKMKVPVVAYVLVISGMLASASMAFAFVYRWEILVGAVLFYLSDLFVARHRFVREERINRIIGLPLYYAGQFILALSLG